MNDTMYAYTPISCRDEDGLYIRGEKPQYIRINTDRGATLVYDSYGLIPEPYAPFAQKTFASFAQPAAVTTESDVAEAVWRAANDATGQLRFPAGADAVALARRNPNS